MAEYHYKYDPPRRDQKKSDVAELFSWLFIVGGLFFFPPLGLFLLFRKLMSAAAPSRSKSRSGAARSYTYARPGEETAPSAPAAERPAPAPAAPKTPGKRKGLAGGGFLAAGGVTTGVFGCSLLISLVEAITSGSLRSALPDLAVLACFTGIGLVLLYVGSFRRKRSKLFRKYQALIGQRDSVSISTLASATGRSYKKVCDELQDMLDLGVLPMGYLDLANDKLVLTSQGITDEPRAQEEPPAPAPEDDNAILAQIKAVNDAIPDPVMSAKIDRIGALTGKILDYQRKNPDKAGQLRGFLNYYLPTTLKILQAYAQLDQQGVEGENISAAKARIEGMMDKVVEGFEKQLDKLFRDEALDITSDVSVLEKMLEKDGLGQGGMTLGGL